MFIVVYKHVITSFVMTTVVSLLVITDNRHSVNTTVVEVTSFLQLLENSIMGALPKHASSMHITSSQETTNCGSHEFCGGIEPATRLAATPVAHLQR